MPLKDVAKPWPSKAAVKDAIDASIKKARASLLAHPVMSKAKDTFRRVMHGTPDELKIEAIFNKLDLEAKKIPRRRISQFWGRTIRSVLEDIKDTDSYKKDDEFDKLLKGTASIGNENAVLTPDNWYGPAETARGTWNQTVHVDRTGETDWSQIPYKMAVRDMIEVLILIDDR